MIQASIWLLVFLFLVLNSVRIVKSKYIDNEAMIFCG